MAFRSSGVGIDLGAHSIRVVELRISEKGAQIRRALLFERASLAERGVDPADRSRLATFLKKEMVEAGLPTKDVAISISGKESIIRYTHVPPVPAWRLQKIMEYETNEMEQKVGEKLTSDYRVLPVNREGDDDQSVIIGHAKEAALEGLLGDLAEAGITVSKAIPSPLALYAAYDAFGKKPDLDSPEDELVVVIDIGAETMNLVFLLNGNLAFARSSTFGGITFTEAIARDLGVKISEAEGVKLAHGTLDLGGGRRREEIVNPLRGVAAQFLSMIQSSLKFSKSQTGVQLPEPTRYVILGGAAGLPGFISNLQGGLRKPVEVFHPSAVPSPEIQGIPGRALAAAPGNFAVALGLAAACARKEGMELNLLPRKYVERRIFRERTIFLYVAAGFLVLFLIVRLVQGFSDSSVVRKRKADLEGWKRIFDQARTEMRENAGQNGKARARINRILREAEATPFQAFVLDFLSKKSGPELKVNSLRFIVDPSEGTDPVYQIQIDGAADNASQKAIQNIEGLRVALASETRVAKVEVPVTAPDGNWYRFTMVITPSYPVHR